MKKIIYQLTTAIDRWQNNPLKAIFYIQNEVLAKKKSVFPFSCCDFNTCGSSGAHIGVCGKIKKILERKTIIKLQLLCLDYTWYEHYLHVLPYAHKNYLFYSIPFIWLFVSRLIGIWIIFHWNEMYALR